MRSITDIEKELDFARRIDDQNWEALEVSDRPQVDNVFAVSSEKRRSLLEQELAEAKAERAHELFGLRLHTPQFSPGTIPLRVLSKLAPIINDAIEQTAWREWDIQGDAAKINDGFRRLINLRLAGINAGSTELVFLGNTAPDLTGESALESGLRNFFDVLAANNQDFPEVVNGIGMNATKSVMRLMKAFESENMGVEFSWNSASNNYHWNGRPDEITRIRALLEEFGDAETATREVRGVVSALSRKRVQIETESDEKIAARYHRSLAEQVNSLHLDQRCDFLLEETSYPSDKIGIKRTAYRLVQIIEHSSNQPAIPSGSTGAES